MGEHVTNLLEAALVAMGQCMRGGALAVSSFLAHTLKAEEGRQ